VHPVGHTATQEIKAGAIQLVHELPQINKTPTVQYCGYDSIIYHYGLTAGQLQNINVVPLHQMGFDGTDVIYGMLDDGFRWKAMNTTKMHQVIGEYDFVFKDSSTANDSLDVPGQDLHGSEVLSAATGLLLDTIIGPAYNASLILAKTEDVRSETPREEDNYAAALEWMENLGVDITSSSLGYKTFDTGFVSYTYNDMNGHTAICSRAAERAAHLGVLCCTAMGNYGQADPPTLNAPADADSILSCGAIFFNDTIANFSSNGPTSDGRLKPEIVAPGVSIATMHADNTIGFEGGTSLSTPLISGACVLVKQAHPEATAQQIRHAVMHTGILFDSTSPNNTYGYGRIDAYNAALKLGTIIGKVKLSRADTIYSVCVPIAANKPIKNAAIIYSFNIGPHDSVIASDVPLALVTDSLVYSGTFPPLPKGTHVTYYVEVTDAADTQTYSPRNAPNGVYDFYIGDTIVNPPFAVREQQNNISLDIFPNPSSNMVTIASNNIEASDCNIIDDLGRTILSFIVPQGEQMIRVHLDDFTTGSYQLRLVSHSGVVTLRTIVVAK
jgi:hypothetical protein